MIERYDLANVVTKASVTHLQPVFDPNADDQDEDSPRTSEDESVSSLSDVDSDGEYEEQLRAPKLKRKPTHFRLTLSDGSFMLAKCVLLATGLTISNVPAWAAPAVAACGSALPARICHSDNLWITGSSAPALYDRRILVVGSGLSSCHLALTALSYNASSVRIIYFLSEYYLLGETDEKPQIILTPLVLGARRGG